MKRNILIDFLKGIAIISVILYHLGISPYGYLGVDVFFVISGYLVSIGLTKNFEKDKFSYWTFFNKRLSRLWPGLIIIAAISLILGYFCMMPMHYKLNCESVVGTLFFTNNFVQYITGGDYWTSTNEYKPLMHTWYVGILMQFYLIIPLVYILAKRLKKNWCRNSVIILTLISLLSLILYTGPLMTESQDFYMLPTRFFELGLGALIAMIIFESREKLTNLDSFYFLSVLIFAIILIFSPAISVIKLRLIIIVGISVLMVWLSNYISLTNLTERILAPITFIGTASYSLYLTHQLLFAFYRYIVNDVFTLTSYLWILLLTFAIGISFYFGIEKPLSKYLTKVNKRMYRANLLCLVSAIIFSGLSVYFYKNKGLVKDIPELDLYVGQKNETPEEYNSISFKYDKDFDDNGKKNIFVLGDSFGRDWINILRESGVDSVMNISYSMYVDEHTKDRIEKADYIFVATNAPFLSSYNYNDIYPELFNRQFYRVGLKSFGGFIGNTYNKRGTSYYFDSKVNETKKSEEINSYERSFFGKDFIDMMTPIKEKDGQIRLFTKDKKLITEDGIHLTKAGAMMYAEKINVWRYLE